MDGASVLADTPTLINSPVMSMKVSNREAIKVTGRAAQVQRPSSEREVCSDAATKIIAQQVVNYRRREKGKKHFTSNCLHLPNSSHTAMQTPAVGKQPSIFAACQPQKNPWMDTESKSET